MGVPFAARFALLAQLLGCTWPQLGAQGALVQQSALNVEVLAAQQPAARSGLPGWMELHERLTQEAMAAREARVRVKLLLYTLYLRASAHVDMRFVSAEAAATTPLLLCTAHHTLASSPSPAWAAGYGPGDLWRFHNGSVPGDQHGHGFPRQVSPEQGSLQHVHGPQKVSGAVAAASSMTGSAEQAPGACTTSCRECPPLTCRALVLAISGDQIVHLLWRLQNGEGPKGLDPQVVTVMIGTNDLAHLTSLLQARVPRVPLLLLCCLWSQCTIWFLLPPSPSVLLLMALMAVRFAIWCLLPSSSCSSFRMMTSALLPPSRVGYSRACGRCSSRRPKVHDWPADGCLVLRLGGQEPGTAQCIMSWEAIGILTDLQAPDASALLQPPSSCLGCCRSSP